MILELGFLQRPLQGRSFPLALVALAASLGLSASAHATNLVSDSGFETVAGGNVYYAGSSIDGGGWRVTLGDIYVDTQDPYVYDGNNSLNLTAVNPDATNTLTQTLNTIVGQSYVVNFFADADTPNIFSLRENGFSVAGITSSIVNNGFPGATANSALFTGYTGLFTATSVSTTLSFSGLADPPIGSSSSGSVVIDDVNVQATPEPDSVVLTLTGMVGLGLMVGRKQIERSLPAR